MNYTDPNRMFLEASLSQVDYFGDLKEQTKQELIYNMNLDVFEQGKTLCEQGKASDRMFVIESGIVKIVTKFDKRLQQNEFVIEKLTRGAIINAKSFLIKDDVDTAFECETTVKCYTLLSQTVDEIDEKQQTRNVNDLKNAKQRVERELALPKNEIALDYIIHNTATESIETFQEKQKDLSLKVRLKNAVMQQWTIVQNQRKSKSIKDLVEEMCINKEKDKKKAEKGNEPGDDGREVAQKVHNPEAYLSKEQFAFLQKKIKQTDQRLGEQNMVV